jgi:Protein of unknown function (DUF4238)
MADIRPVDQHYVTAGFLRGFLPDGEKALHVRRRDGDNWFRQKPENIATRANFYSVFRSGGEYDDTVEHALAQLVEAPGLAALHQLKKGATIPSWHERMRISFLLAVQYLRVPRTIQAVRGTMEQFAMFITKELFAHPDYILDVARRKNIAIRTEEEVAKIHAALGEGRFGMTANPTVAMGMALMSMQEVSELLAARQWTVYVATDPSFYASYFPVYPSPATIPSDGVVGLADPTIRVCAPISSRRVLVMDELDRSDDNLNAAETILGREFARTVSNLPPIVTYRSATADDISRFNIETCLMCEEFICGPAESTEIDRFLKLEPYRYEVRVASRGDLLISSNRWVR